MKQEEFLSWLETTVREIMERGITCVGIVGLEEEGGVLTA